ncbi:D-glycero-alpha-D-manno-heptose-1,7-bisphosphate 7-phosphatase [Candidatus Bipolaricaulota bacterium]
MTAKSASKPEHGNKSDTPFIREGGAVLLDRDGVISQQTAFVNEPDDLKLIDGAAEAIGRLNLSGWPVAIITNQGGIAMGYLTEETLFKIHERLEQLLSEVGAHVDAIFYCAHHDRAKLPEYKSDCCGRKPQTGMLEQAREELGIDLSRSVVVGDATTDILAGIRAGCSTILVETGFGGTDGKTVAEPDAIVTDISAAVDLILSTASPDA